MITNKNLLMMMYILLSEEKIKILNLYPVLLNSKTRALWLISSSNVFFLFELYESLKTIPHFSLYKILKLIFSYSFYLLENFIAFFFFLVGRTNICLYYHFLVIFQLLNHFVYVLECILFFLKPSLSNSKPLPYIWTMASI